MTKVKSSSRNKQAGFEVHQLDDKESKHNCKTSQNKNDSADLWTSDATPRDPRSGAQPRWYPRAIFRTIAETRTPCGRACRNGTRYFVETRARKSTRAQKTTRQGVSPIHEKHGQNLWTQRKPSGLTMILERNIECNWNFRTSIICTTLHDWKCAIKKTPQSWSESKFPQREEPTTKWNPFMWDQIPSWKSMMKEPSKSKELQLLWTSKVQSWGRMQ